MDASDTEPKHTDRSDTDRSDTDPSDTDPRDTDPRDTDRSDRSDTDRSDTDRSDTDAAPAESRPRRSYQPGRWRRLENAVMSALVSGGLVPHSYLLTTRGFRTGRARSNPVLVVEHDGRRWLVAPYGAVSWVHNARAAGQVRLARRRETRAYAVREVGGQEAGPVLRRYVQIASATRQYFQADQGDPVESFIAEAGLHPVFELTPVGPESPLLFPEGPGPE